MKFVVSKLLLASLFVMGIAAIGCDGRPVAGPTQDKAKVDVDVGGGKGVQVDVEGREPADPTRRKADVDVDIGGGKGINVDVNKEP